VNSPRLSSGRAAPVCQRLLFFCASSRTSRASTFLPVSDQRLGQVDDGIKRQRIESERLLQ
jgi:hypothetical protein